MAMTSAQRKALDRILEVLAEDLDVTPAIIHLKSKEILKDIDEEKINAKTTQNEKVMELVKIIKKRGKKAFGVLRDYLKNCSGSEHLAEELDEKLDTVEAELAGLKLQEDGRKQIEKWKELEEKFHFIRCQHDNIGRYRYIPEEINILLIGKTGSGKSATGNTLTGKNHFKTSGSKASLTKTIDMKQVTEDRFRIKVIDTPGLFDTALDLRNEETMHEIAKTMVNFRGGIHLILLVCSATRFTQEEQDVIAAIEKRLKPSVYKNCVLVLTYAHAQFGVKGTESLREHITNETKRGGKFADLLRRVQHRVIAVENLFEDDFLREKHRQSLLCYLAQVIQDNKGSAYTDPRYEHLKIKLEKLEEERKRRIQRELELTTMRSQINNYLLQKYLKDLNEKQLDNIQGHFKTDLLYIMARSGVNQLPCITVEDVRNYLDSFIWEKYVLITNLKEKKIQETKQQEEYERRRRILKEKENVSKVQQIVLPSVSNYLKPLSRADIDHLLEKREFPSDVMVEIGKDFASSNLKVDDRQVATYIDQTFFQNASQIRSYMNDNSLTERLEENSKQLKQVQRGQKLNAILINLKAKIDAALEEKTDEELRGLNSELLDNGVGRTVQWHALIEQLVLKDIAGSDIAADEISNVYLKQHLYLLRNTLSAMFERRQTEREASERQQREELKNSALRTISDVIEIKLKSYLTGKSSKELKRLDSDISKGVVPSDIFSKVTGYLTNEQKQSLTDNEIKREIICQIKAQNKIIDECKNNAKCFPGSSKVIIKGRGISNISIVEVDDEILVFDEKGNCFFSKVYLKLHASEEADITFIRLKTFSGKELFISPSHLIPIGSFDRYVAGKDVQIGDVIFTLQNGVMTVDSVIATSYELCRGAYCPITMNGKIVVDDVGASCYTNVIPAPITHLLFSPVRILYSCLPLSLFHKFLPYDEEGRPLLLVKFHTIGTSVGF